MKTKAIALLLCLVMLAGCVTTTAPDGTTTTSIDSNLVAAMLPSILDLANKYLDAKVSQDQAAAEAKRQELESRRAMMEMLITDPDLRREVLGLIDSFLQQGEEAAAPPAEAISDAA